MDKTKDTKIFFTDLDGTLLTKDKTITPKTMTALEKWTDAGHKFALSSGRAIDSVKNVKESLKLHFPGMYLIGYNGGEIYDCENDRIINRIPLTLEQTALIMQTAKEMDIHCHTYTDTHIISPADNDELACYCRAIHTPVIIREDILSALDKPPCKCIAIEIHDKNRLEQFRTALMPKAKGELTLLYSNDKYLEIFPSCSGKGTAVKTLCEYLNISLANSLAAGDECNDISMLQTAGTGIAMLNAKDEVKEAADIITQADNDHDGLASVLISHI